jgi:hypothetical protein
MTQSIIFYTNPINEHTSSRNQRYETTNTSLLLDTNLNQSHSPPIFTICLNNIHLNVIPIPYRSSKRPHPKRFPHQNTKRKRKFVFIFLHACSHKTACTQTIQMTGRTGKDQKIQTDTNTTSQYSYIIKSKSKLCYV